MSESWIKVGAPVLITSDIFSGFEGVIESIDPSANTVGVSVELFGKRVPMTFPNSSVAEHFVPFGDQPVVWHCPPSDLRQQELLSWCPKADAAYRTDDWRETTHMDIQVARIDSEYRLAVRSFDLTWPLGTKMDWAVHESLPNTDWMAFDQLVEECHFWDLPYDDGRRIPREGRSTRWRLEGLERGRYHAVQRQAMGFSSEISTCCGYLRALADRYHEHAEK